ncbi:MAG: toxin-antitoxin system YwqK family antitoxin [Bacteroidia bacterium]
MRITFIFFFITSISFGQFFTPKNDTIIYNKDGSESHYHVQSNAIQMTTYKNGTWNGPFRGYYRNGKLWVEDNRVNGRIEGKNIEYTPNGDTAKITVWKNASPYSEKIFYSSTRKDDQKYYFVSKKGFVTILNGVQTKLDKTTPDSLIEEGIDNAHMWIKGERKLLWGEEDAKYIIVTTGDKPGMYKIEGDKKTFFRPFTEGENKMFMKAKKEELKKK